MALLGDNFPQILTPGILEDEVKSLKRMNKSERISLGQTFFDNLATFMGWEQDGKSESETI